MENHTEHPMENMKGKTCGCGHHKVVPILVIIFGLEFLFAQLNVLTWSFVDITWPIIVIVVGVMKLNKGRCACCSK